jgi:hypothetical protein
MKTWPNANEKVTFKSRNMYEEKEGKFKSLDEIGGVYFGVVVVKEEDKETVHWVRNEHIKR